MDPGFEFSENNFEEEVVLIFVSNYLIILWKVRDMLKTLGYPFTISKSSLSAVGSPHTWPPILAMLVWVIELLNYLEKLQDEEVFLDVSFSMTLETNCLFLTIRTEIWKTMTTRCSSSSLQAPTKIFLTIRTMQKNWRKIFGPQTKKEVRLSRKKLNSTDYFLSYVCAYMGNRFLGLKKRMKNFEKKWRP